VVLRHYYSLKLDEAAEVLGLDREKADELYETAIVEAHQAMLRAAVLQGPTLVQSQAQVPWPPITS
jgi:hypothetical protein